VVLLGRAARVTGCMCLCTCLTHELETAGSFSCSNESGRSLFNDAASKLDYMSRFETLDDGKQ
jgi:hypothetical protein